MKSPNIDYFKYNIESSLARVFVNRRVAELLGFDAKELDDFIGEKSKAFLNATKSKGVVEMIEVIDRLDKEATEYISDTLKQL